VLPQVRADEGVSELWRHARLKWLDSTIGLDDEVTAPYTPLEVRDTSVACLGRQVTFGSSGLPQSIRSGQREILANPIAMTVETGAGSIPWTGGKATVTRTAPAAATIESHSTGQPLQMTCRARMEADGYINVGVILRAERAVEVKDIRLEIPFRRDGAAYMMGLGRKGGLRPDQWHWAWDINRANNMVWLGDYDAGLQCKLKGPRDTWDIASLHAGGIPES
jgi:hypothetical protein